MKIASSNQVVVGRKGSFVEVLKKPPPIMKGRKEARGVAGGEEVQPRNTVE